LYDLIKFLAVRSLKVIIRLYNTILFCFITFVTYSQQTSKIVQEADNLVSEKRYNDAIVKYSKAIKNTPTKSEYYLKRGIAYFYNAEDSLALNDYNSVLKLDSLNAHAYFNIGRLKSYSRLNKDAIVNYYKTLK